jgi:hypothetical protein
MSEWTPVDQLAQDTRDRPESAASKPDRQDAGGPLPARPDAAGGCVGTVYEAVGDRRGRRVAVKVD